MFKFTPKKVLFFLILSFSLIETKAQDIQFSMFYAVPLYINPAFAGSRHANRAMLHHRFQWASQEGRYYTTMASFDTYSMKYNSGIGAMLMYDYGNTLTSTILQLQYAYELRLNSVHTLRFGLQGGFMQTAVSSLTLPQDVSNDGLSGKKSFGGTNFFAPDISAGILWYAKRLYVSLSFHHLNRPQYSLLNNSDSRWPTKLTLTGGYKIPIRFGGDDGTHTVPVTMSVTPTITYKKQMGAVGPYFEGTGSGDQVDLGIYYTYNWLIAGLWYRGIPFTGLKDERTGRVYNNNESVVFLIGASYQSFGVGYAYDLTVSTQSTRTGGSHEINLSYVFRTKHTKKPLKSLPCPDFEYEILQRGSAGRAK